VSEVIMFVASSGKRNVTVWRPFVYPSVCLSCRHTYRDSPNVYHMTGIRS